MYCSRAIRNAGALAALSLCACTPAVPDWAIHVKPPRVTAQTALETWKPRLLRELQAPGYEPGHTAPEQIAVLAVHELRREHPWDAAVLLTLASHRYYEQAYYAYIYGSSSGYETARDETNGYLSDADYAAYLKLEVQTFREAGFEDELDRLSARLGAALEAENVQTDLMRVVMGNLSDRYAAMQALQQRAENQAARAPERLAHPDLAAGVKARLVREAQGAVHAATAAQFLARSPLADFRLAALEAAPLELDGFIVSAGAYTFATQPERIVAALASERASTRAHAAVVLGVSEALAHLPAVEALLQVEADPGVQRALHFALIRMGEHQHLAALMQAASGTDPGHAAQALLLLGWLPPDVQAGLSQVWLTGRVRSGELPALARIAAASCLREIARHKPLEPQALQALLELPGAYAGEDDAVSFASSMVAELEQLDRHVVLQAARARRAPIDPWLARWEKLAQAQDLPLLQRLLERTPSDQLRIRLSLVRVAAAIPGAQAQAMLQAWYARYPELRSPIAVWLVLRSDVDKQRLSRLVRDDASAAALILLLPLGDPISPERMRDHVLSRDPNERFAATLALKLFGKRDHVQYLWPNVGYHDAKYYPGDVRLRQLALSALLDVELNRYQRPELTAVAQ